MREDCIAAAMVAALSFERTRRTLLYAIYSVPRNSITTHILPVRQSVFTAGCTLPYPTDPWIVLPSVWKVHHARQHARVTGSKRVARCLAGSCVVPAFSGGTDGAVAATNTVSFPTTSETTLSTIVASFLALQRFSLVSVRFRAKGT